ncbi:extracellular solute-binding protein [Streptomyces carpaticus]|uniref:extracellular solute-binding protein n=1 Tax=Streptomyces carpaticus TaxID=285558 RepID=UPI0022018987|nr:extracellular solute-binding protein [Streptomyces carpaticus]
MRWRWALLLAPLAVLAGCPGAPESGRDGGPVDDGRPLVVVSGADLTSREGEGVRQALIDEWNADDGNRPARLVELPRTEDGQRSELIAALQSGSADFDVVNLDTTWVPEFAEAGLIRPLDDALLEAGFLAQAAEAGRWRGRAYAVPFNTDVGLLYYREDLLAALGGTPEDLLADGTLGALIDARPAGQEHPLYITQLRPYEGLTVNTLEALWSVGVELVDERGRYRGTEAELRRGLAELLRVADGAKLSERARDADETVALREFTGDGGGDGPSGVVLMRNWPFAYPQLDATLPAQTGFGVLRLPGAAALGGQSLAVPAGSARAADAERLIRFLTAEPGSQRRLLEAGFAPALREAYGAAEPDCAAAPRVVRRTEAQRVPEGAVRGLPPGYPEFLWCALQEARARPASPYYPAFSRELRQEVAQLLAGGGSLEGTAERLHQSLALALEGRLPP